MPYLNMDPTGLFPQKLHPASRFGFDLGTVSNIDQEEIAIAPDCCLQYVHAKKKTVGQTLKQMHVNLFNMDMLMLKVRLFQHLPA